MLQIEVTWIMNSWMGITLFLIASIGIKWHSPLKETNSFDTTLNFFKLMVYGFLAFYIYQHIYYSNASTIDILTAFTFALASLEAVHTFHHTVGAWAGAKLKYLFGTEIKLE